MTVDLPSLLDEAAPAPREAVDVDAVLRRGRQLGRRRLALQGAFAVAAVLAIAGVSSLLVDAPRQPFVGEGRVPATPTPVPGTYADGAVVVSEPGRDATLDLRTDARLSGEPLTELGMVPTAFAVATDRAIGVLDGTILRIIGDGGETISRANAVAVLSDLARSDPAVTDWPSSSAQLQETDPTLAFDAGGTLWLSVAGPGGAVVGLHRDGDVTATAGPRRDHQLLRVVDDAVSVLTFTDGAYGSSPAEATVVPIAGEDPRAGTHVVRTFPDPAHYAYRGINLTEDRLAIASILGVGRVHLANQPSTAGVEMPRSVLTLWGTAQVADTAAGLVARTRLGAAVLIVHRPGGTVVGALLDGRVQPGSEQRLSISPDGAVHLASATPEGGMTVATLLQPDLRPAGTEADAVTGGTLDEAAVAPFAVDRPFAFAITDTTTGTVLFLGGVTDPRG